MVNIAGLQKMTLLDFPGKVACTVFLSGCQFRCPYCHNSELLVGDVPTLMSGEEFLDFLSSRKGLLDAVCVSGGEPTLQAGLPAFLGEIKKRGFAVKLDTNGARPQVLKSLVADGLVDYVAMDIKNSPSRYAATVGLTQYDISAVEESAAFLMTGAVPYEFRTTVVAELHDDESIAEMGEWLVSLNDGCEASALYLQPFVDRDTVCFSGLSAPQTDALTRFLDVLRPVAQTVQVRGA